MARTIDEIIADLTPRFEATARPVNVNTRANALHDPTADQYAGKHLVVGKWEVVDGDTVKDLETGEEIRLNGIDTSEVSHEMGTKAGERGGQQQKVALYQLLREAGEGVVIERTGDSTYGRSVATLKTKDGRDLNKEMIAKGAMASAYSTDEPYIKDAIEQSRDSNYNRSWRPADEQDEFIRMGSEKLQELARTPKDQDATDIISNSFGRGVDQAGMMNGAFVEALGEQFGFESWKDFGRRMKVDNQIDIELNPAVTSSYEDVVESADDGLFDLFKTGATYVTERTLEALPAMAGDMAVGLAAGATALPTGGGSLAATGAAITARQVAMSQFKRRMMIGMYGANWKTLAGESYANLQHDGVADDDAAWTSLLITGPINAALDTVSDARLLASLKFGGPGAVARVKDIIREGAKAAGINMGVEGLTESAQAITVELAKKAHLNDYQLNRHEILESFFAGMAVGGALGGAGRTLTATMEYAGSTQVLNTEPNDFTPEPRIDLNAQVDDLVDSESKRAAILANTENAEQVRASLNEKGYKFVEQELENGDVLFQPEGAEAIEDSEAGRQSVLGYSSALSAAIESGADGAFEVVTPDGAVKYYEVPERGQEKEVEAKLLRDYPNDMLRWSSAEDILARRKQLIEQENADPSLMDVELETESSIPANFDSQNPSEQTRERRELPTDPVISDEPFVYRNPQVVAEERGSETIYADVDGTLRPREEVAASLGAGRVTLDQIIEGLVRLGILSRDSNTRRVSGFEKLGEWGLDGVVDKLKIDREQTARNLDSAGVYVVPGRRVPAQDIASNPDITDRDLIELASYHQVPIAPFKGEGKPTTQALGLKMLTALYNSAKQERSTKESLPARENARSAQVVEANERQKQTEQQANKDKARDYDNSPEAVQTARELAPLLFRLGAADAELVGQTDVGKPERAADPLANNDEMWGTTETIEALARRDGIVMFKPARLVQQGQLTDKELKIAAQTLGVEYAENAFSRKKLIVDLQNKVRDTLVGELRAEQDANLEREQAGPYLRQAAFDAQVAVVVARAAEIDAGPAIESIMFNSWTHYLNDLADNDVADAALFDDAKLSEEEFTTAAKALLNSETGDYAEARNEQAGRVAAMVDPKGLSAGGLYQALEKAGAIGVDPELYAAPGLNIHATKPEEKRLNPANATGESFAPVATDDPVHFHEQRQQSTVRASAVILDENDAVWHTGAAKDATVTGGRASFHAQLFNNANLIFAPISERFWRLLPHVEKKQRAPKSLSAGYDAVSITNLGREYASNQYGGRYGELLNAFWAGVDMLERWASTEEVAGQTGAPLVFDAANIRNDVVIGYDPNTGQAITLGEAMNAASSVFASSPDLQHINYTDVVAEIEVLEKELEDTYSELSIKTDSLLDLWFYRALNYGEQHDVQAGGAFEGAVTKWRLIDKHAPELDRTARKEANASYKKVQRLIQLRQLRNRVQEDGANAIELADGFETFAGEGIESGSPDSAAASFAYAMEQADPEAFEVEQSGEASNQQRDPKTAAQRKTEVEARLADRSQASVQQVPTNDVRNTPELTSYLDQPTWGQLRGEANPEKLATRLGGTFDPVRKIVFAAKGSRIENVVFGMIQSIRSTLGFKQPLVVITPSKLDNSALPLEVREKLKAELKGEGKMAGAYLAAGDFGVIVMPDVGAPAERLTVFAHELGHAFFETHLATLSPTAHRKLLKMAKAEGVERADFHEWLADQFAHWAIDGSGFRLGRMDADIQPFVNRVINGLIAIWSELKKMLGFDVSESAQQYIQNVSTKYRQGEQTTVRKLKQDTVHNMTGRQAASSIWAKAKAAWKSDTLVPIYRSVAARLEKIDRTLRQELYQYSQSVQGSQAWQQITNFLTDRWTGLMERSLAGMSDAQLLKGWNDLRAGVKSEEAAKVRAIIDRIEKDMKARTHYHSRKNFMPEAFSHEAIAARRAEFETLIEEHFGDKVTKEEATRIADSILYSDGINDLSVSPGKAVSQHAHVDRLLANEGFRQAVIEQEFVLTNPRASLHHFINTAAKRTAWEQKFGGFVEVTHMAPARLRLLESVHYDMSKVKTDEMASQILTQMGLESDGKLYSANAKLNEHLDRIRATKGAEAANQARRLIRNAMGLDGQNMPEKLRSVQSWIITFLNYTMLAFSGIASLPEIAGGMVRGAGRTNLRDVFEVIADFRKNHNRAVDLGIVLSDMAEQAAMETMGPEYQSPAQHKAHYWLFKLNGQQAVMKIARTMAVGLAQRYIVRSVEAAQSGDPQGARDLASLNLSLEEAQRWVSQGMRGSLAVDQAINQFAYESVIRPSRFEATAWGNNPYLKLAWHLKQFFYSYWNVIFGGIWRAMGGRYNVAKGEGTGTIPAGMYAMVPAMIAGMFIIPLAMGGQEIREWIRGKDTTEGMDVYNYTRTIMSKSGGFGPAEILLNMKQASDWGRSPLFSLTPVTSKLEQVLDLGKDGKLSQQELESKIRSLTPIFSQNPNLWNALF